MYFELNGKIVQDTVFENRILAQTEELNRLGEEINTLNEDLKICIREGQRSSREIKEIQEEIFSLTWDIVKVESLDGEGNYIDEDYNLHQVKAWHSLEDLKNSMGVEILQIRLKVANYDIDSPRFSDGIARIATLLTLRGAK